MVNNPTRPRVCWGKLGQGGDQSNYCGTNYLSPNLRTIFIYRTSRQLRLEVESLQNTSQQWNEEK